MQTRERAVEARITHVNSLKYDSVKSNCQKQFCGIRINCDITGI